MLIVSLIPTVNSQRVCQVPAVRSGVNTKKAVRGESAGALQTRKEGPRGGRMPVAEGDSDQVFHVP